MWKWFKRRFGGGATTAHGTLVLGQDSITACTTRKGKSIISDAIVATGAEDGDVVAIDRDGRSRIVGRTPRVVVDNTQ
jgi:hypothetical protein